MTKQIVFWKYDGFPYYLWDELYPLDQGIKNSDDEFVTVKGYDGMRFKKAFILPEDKANKLIKKLTDLTLERTVILNQFDTFVEECIRKAVLRP